MLSSAWYNRFGGPNFSVTVPQPYNKIGDGPEGPEVALTAEELHRSLVGKTLSKVDVADRAKHDGLDTISQFLPAKFMVVESIGKKIIFYLQTLSDPDKPVVFCIGSMLAMEGHWGWDSKKKHIHLTFHLDSEEKLYFDDTRHFGRNTLILNDSEKANFLKAVGICLIRHPHEVTPELWKKHIRNPRRKKTQICVFLMEQKYFAGIGNYLKAEILYASKIRPDRPLGELSDEEIESLRTNALSIIKESYESQGLTIATFYTPSGNKGSFQCKVYSRKTDPSGNPVVTGTFKDNRTTHWVPAVQT